MMTQKAVIIGAKQFNGEVEGKRYDSCKVRAMMSVPSDSQNEIGYNVVELNFGSSSNFKRFTTYKFPFNAELSFDLEIKSGKPVMTLVDFKQVQNDKENPLK